MKECKYCGKEFEPRNNAQKNCNECLKLGRDILKGKTFDCRKVQACEGCGILYIRDHKTRFCTEECSNKTRLNKVKEQRLLKEKTAYTNSCLICGNEFTTACKDKLYCSKLCKNKAATLKRVPVRTDITYICQCCGKEYHPKSAERNKYCSRECCFKYKAEHPTIHPEPIKANPICVICGKEFERGTHGFMYCSDECYRQKELQRYSNYKNSDQYQQDLKKKRDNRIPKPSKWKICVVCGKMFQASGHAGICCSPGCKAKNDAEHKHDGNARRRAAICGAYVGRVNRRAVYQRDGGVCQLCGGYIDMTVSTSHPLSFSVDHIKPLALGGTHEMGNVQAAHFICNSFKSARENISLEEYALKLKLVLEKQSS